MKDWSRTDVPELISVIVTTYNREDALEAVLRRCRARATGISRSSSLTTARVPRPRRWSSAGDRVCGAARARLARGSRLSRGRDPQPRDPRLRAAATASSSTAIASCGPTSSRRIGAWPSPDGSSPATACCFRRPSRRPCCATTCGLKAGAHRRWIGERLRGGVNRLSAVLRLPLGPLRKLRIAPVAGRALLQSRDLAVRSRSCRRLRCLLQRLGPRGFRSADPTAALWPASQGRSLRDRRHPPLAPAGRSRATGCE